MPRTFRSVELGAFLRRRRSERAPEEVGLPETDESRRVSGLRRQEVAALASISTDYYTRIEQGRITASLPVLANLVQALRLSPDEWMYMLKLAVDKPLPQFEDLSSPQVDITTHRILNSLEHAPAFVIGPLTEILAWNDLAGAVFMDFAQVAPEERFFVKLLLTEPSLQSLYADWEEGVQLAIAQLRMHTAYNPESPRLIALVEELSALSPQFTDWWQAREVNIRTTGTKHLHHPTVGDLEFEWSALTCPGSPTQQLIAWTSAPGSPTHQAMQKLAATL